MTFKPKVNLVIDALMMLCLTAMAGIGLMIKFVLLPGRERLLKYGRPVGLTWLGLDRHQWGTIHLSLAVALLALLALHIVLHWPVTLNIFRRMVASRSARWAIALALAVLSVVLIAFPLLVKPEVGAGGEEGHGGGFRYRGRAEPGAFPSGPSDSSAE